MQRVSIKPIMKYFTSERKTGSKPLTELEPCTADFSELAAVAETSGVSCMPNMQNSVNNGRIVHTVFNSQRGAGYGTINRRPMPQLDTIHRQTNGTKFRFVNSDRNFE